MMEDNKSQASEQSPSPNEPSTGAALAEPFACPNCGQMLGPGCTVCAACREAVDFAKVRVAAAVLTPAPAPVGAHFPAGPLQPHATVGQSQFSLPIFIVSVLLYLTVVGAAASVLTITNFRYFLAGLLVACTAWVIYDAHAKQIPHPLRWGLGTFFIWVVVFPWYLSRRRKPEVPCPIMDAQGRSFARTVVFVFVLCGILYCLVSVVMRKPPG
ncbi:MAG TPA: hypothetical protein VGX94_18355 [Terriglobia bacterium]|nr:hypothetical protein [Terriglobia bacterium]